MHRTLMLASFSLVAACAPPSGRSDGDGSTDPLQQLAADTGHSWRARWRNDLHTPALLEGGTAPMAVTAADATRAGRAFIRRYGALFRMSDDDDVSATDAVTDELGMTHARFQQQAGDWPVWGGELVVHFDASGSLVRINGRFIPIARLPDAPTKTADQARVVAVTAARAAWPSIAPDGFTTSTAKLWVYPAGDDARLAWRVPLDAVGDASFVQLDCWVDAGDGSVLGLDDVTARLDGSGVGVLGDRQPLVVAPSGASYVLEDATRGAPPSRTYGAGGSTRRPGTLVRSKDPTSWDSDGPAAGAAVDAHAYVAAAWDYFASVHGRQGWADDDKGAHATVHFAQRFAGAFFDEKELVFGDGDDDFAPLAGARDIVVHEFTHAVIDHTARLGRAGQPGALAEAIADLFACFVDGNWQIGEAVYHPGGHPQPLRDLVRPHDTNDPETLAELVTGDDDNGAVHANSTIVSHAAYVMTQAAPPSLVERIWYRALVRYLWSSADFADAADATLAAARDLGGDGAAAVHDAWAAAGAIE